MRRRLIGDDVELDALREEQRDQSAAFPTRATVFGPSRPGGASASSYSSTRSTQPSRRRCPLARIDLDDERSPSVMGDGETLRAAHAAEPGREDAPPRERPAEVRGRYRPKRLVREPEDALRADVEPPRSSHLPVHRQPGRLEPTKGIVVRPGGHEHRRRDEDARRVLVRPKHGDRLARLDE